jgi:flavin reductase (DIM6/NTAB) family NADH-FMN oxidoreductase RutF
LDEIDLVGATKQALRRLATTVCVISTRHEDERFLMAATAVEAMSMDPPSMLVCVNRSASMHAPLAAGADFAINILSADQEDISRICGGGAKGAERFACGLPLLGGAQANVVCKQDGLFAYGTHTIVIGRVQSVTVGDVVDPLLYVDGRYTRVPA